MIPLPVGESGGHGAFPFNLTPYVADMATMDLEEEVLYRVMLGELNAPALDDEINSPLTCLSETDS